MVGEQTLSDIVKESEASGPTYRYQVQSVMRASYSHHYRRMLPLILDTLAFRSNNRRHRPVIKALEWLKATRDSKQRQFPLDGQIPIDGIVPGKWEEFIREEDHKNVTRVNRIPYELCVLEALRERLRCREIWVDGAERFRNPDEDLPTDFETKRGIYYDVLAQPQDAQAFIGKLQTTLAQALFTLDRDLPENRKVMVLNRPRNPIRLSPLTAQPEPLQLSRLKAEVGRRWPMTSLLDVLKEADLRIGFTDDFRSVATREVIARGDLQQRLLLCLFGLGTNAGLKAVSANGNEISYGNKGK